MLPTGVLFLWCLVAQAQEPGSAEAPTITNRATDPWGALGKAEQLLRSDRPDEAVATLHAASSDPVTAEAAKRQLAAALLTLPPRPAWAAAYARALSSPGVPQRSELELRALRAAGMDPSRHSAARSQLTELLRRSPGDVDIRYALGEVLLRGGQPDKALEVFQGGGSRSNRLDQGAAYALLALGRVDEASRLSSAELPGSCVSSGLPAPCAVALAEKGFPAAGIAGLKRAVDTNAFGAKSEREKAEAWVAMARIADAEQGAGAAVPYWKRASQMRSTDAAIREGYIQALLRSGAVSTARTLAAQADSRTQRTVQAVDLASKVDPSGKKGNPAPSLEKARELDATHPVVVRAWSHHLIVQSKATERKDLAIEAMTLLARQAAEAPSDRGWLDLYSWAAFVAGEPEKAAELLERGLPHMKNQADWEKVIKDLAKAEELAANKDKQAARLDMAEDRYERAQRLNPGDLNVLRGLGGVRWELGASSKDKKEEALVAWREAWRTSPGDRESLVGLVGLLRDLDRGDEAQTILRGSAWKDESLADLQRDLELEAMMRPARDASRRGQHEVALAEYQRLKLMYPNNALVLHGMADAYAGLEKHEQAAEHYHLARIEDPGNVWLAVGEARALLAMGEIKLARGAISGMEGLATDTVTRDELTRIDRAVTRAEADQLLQRGRDKEALGIYEKLLEKEVDGWTLAGLGELYRARWQYDAAEAYYEAATARAPKDEEIARGYVRLLVERGRHEQAEEKVALLCAANPSSTNLTLAREVEKHRAIADAREAVRQGRMERARTILDGQLETWPEDPNLRIARATLDYQDEETDAPAAWNAAREVLKTDPANPGALGLAQRAGLAMGKPEEVARLYQKAKTASDEAWLDKELEALELASRLALAEKQHRDGQPDLSRTTMADAERRYGDNHARHWSMLGTSWLRMKEAGQAVRAYEIALSLDPADGGAARGLAGAWMARGDMVAAERVLETHYEAHPDVQTGEMLAEIQAARGRNFRAEMTRSSLCASEVPAGRPAGAPEPLKVMAVPGTAEAPAAVQSRPASDSDPFIQEMSLDESGASPTDPYRFSLQVGVGGAQRPGSPGNQFMNLFYAPMGLELPITGSFRLEGEVVPVRVADGLRVESGTAATIGFVTNLEGLYTRLHLGNSPAGFTTGTYLIGYGAAGARVASLTTEVEAGRAPVTDSLVSLAGAYDADGNPYGQVSDLWGGARLDYSPRPGLGLGAIGRFGRADGIALPSVPWTNALVWGRMPLDSRPGQNLSLSVEGIYLQHDRQVDGFQMGDGGFFSPELFLSGMGRLEASWDSGRWSACGLAGGGPQLVQGERTVYLGPGLYFGYITQGIVSFDLGSHWSIDGHATHQGSWGAWGQTAGMVSLRKGHPNSGLYTPTAAVVSPVHGPPLLTPTWCSAVEEDKRQ